MKKKKFVVSKIFKSFVYNLSNEQSRKFTMKGGEDSVNGVS